MLMGCVLLIFVYVHSQRHLLSPSHFSLRFVCIYIALFFLQHLIGIPEGDEEEIERMQKRNSSPPAAGASHFFWQNLYYIFTESRKKNHVDSFFFFCNSQILPVSLPADYCVHVTIVRERWKQRKKNGTSSLVATLK